MDENGEPRVVYHGSYRHGFTTSRKSETGIYFTPDRAVAQRYSDLNPYAVFLNLRDPIPLDFEDESDMEETETHGTIHDEYRNALANGYDGLIAENTFDGENTLTQIVAKDPEQIKSATDNSEGNRSTGRMGWRIAGL